MFSLQSSNPALHNEQAFNPYAYQEGEVAAQPANVTTLQGVVNKTALLTLIAVAGGVFGYWLVGQMGWQAVWISNVAAFITAIGIYFVIAGKPALAPVLGPIYAVVEGVFLGALTGGLDGWLASMDIAMPGGVALTAFIITVSILCAMLTLYKLRILRPTKRFRAVVMTAAGGVMIAYGLTWILGFFGVSIPFLRLSSAVEGTTPALIGIGINVLILGVASLMLIIDFGEVEERIAQGAPKKMEWYCAFILLVTLAWVYFEAVKLAFRLAILFGGRE